MAKNEAKIKFTAETGEFNSAIKKANGEMSELRAELKLNETQMKATGTTVEGLEKKHSILANQLSASESKTEALSQKVQKAVEIFGENSEEASKLRVQLLNAQNAEEKLRQAVGQCADELKQQKEVADKASSGLEEIDDSAEDAEKGLDDVEDSADKAGGSLANLGGKVCDSVVTGLKSVAVATGAAVTGFLAAAETTREYREAQGKLDAAFASAGKSAKTAESTYSALVRVIGESDQSVEAAQQIALLAKSEQDAGKWAGYASGIVGKFGDALQPETFYESANETLKLGVATGAYTQMLEGCGFSVEKFNEGLAACATEEEKQAFMLATTEKALGAAGKAYEKNNADILAANDANAQLADSMADIGAAAEPVMTTVKMFGAGVLADLSPAVTLIGEGLTGAMNGTEGAAETLAEGVGGAIETVSTVLENVLGAAVDVLPSLITNIIPVFVDGITSLISSVAGAMPGLVSAITDILPEIIAGITVIFGAIVSSLPDLIQSIVSALPTLIPELVNGLVTMFVMLCSNFAQIIQPIIDYLPEIIVSIVDALITNLPAIIEGLINLIMGIVSALPQIIQGLVDALPTIISMLISGLLSNLPAIILGLVEVVGGVIKAIPQIFGSMVQAVANVFVGIWDGLRNIFGSVGPWIYENVIQPIVNFFTNLWNRIVEGVTTAINSVKNVFSTVANWINTNVIQPVVNFFTGLWNKITSGVKSAISGVKNVFSTISNFVNTKVIQPVKKLFTNLWNGFKTGAQNAWNGVKNVFSKVGSFFGDIFNTVKDKILSVFSAGGKVFNNIKEGIVNVFKTVVNGIIKGINKVIAAPFKGLNSILDTIHDISIVGVKPFTWLTWRAPVPQIPLLAEGGIVDRPTLNIAGEAGPEAIVPIDKLQAYIAGAVERAIQAVNIQTLAAAIEDLASRPISLNINGRQFAYATASDSDSVNGLRSTFQSRGLALD